MKIAFFECCCLVALCFMGLASFLIGGKVWLGWWATAFMYVTFGWALYRIWMECRDELKEEWDRHQAFKEVRSKTQHRWKSLE